MNYFVNDNKEKISFIDIIYPVGSIYMSVNNTSPSTLFEGTSWSKIEGRFLLGSSSTHSAEETGGEETHTLTIDEMPAHTHTRGTMNITGQVGLVQTNGGSGSGALTAGNNGQNPGQGTRYYDHWATLYFNAANNWTGESSSVGAGAAHNNMPPYFVVNIWQRDA